MTPLQPGRLVGQLLAEVLSSCMQSCRAQQNEILQYLKAHFASTLVVLPNLVMCRRMAAAASYFEFPGRSEAPQEASLDSIASSGLTMFASQGPPVARVSTLRNGFRSTQGKVDLRHVRQRLQFRQQKPLLQGDSHRPRQWLPSVALICQFLMTRR